MTYAIVVADATKRYGDFVALDHVDFVVPTGSLTALLGPSGSGKSTLLRTIAGLDQPDTGTITINGRDVTRVPPQRRGIGFVFQHYAAFKHLTVRDNVAFGLKIRKRPKAEIKAKVDNLLQVVGLSGFQSRYPNQLSGGQRQRMALARALAVDPEVLLLDEPFGALDVKVREELRAWLRRLHTRCMSPRCWSPTIRPKRWMWPTASPYSTRAVSSRSDPRPTFTTPRRTPS